MPARFLTTALAILAIAAALANCSGMPPLHEEGVRDGTPVPATAPDPATFTITDTCLSETHLLLAFTLNGKSHRVATALSAPEPKIGASSLQISAPFRVLTALPAADWLATEQCTRRPGVMGTWRWNELLYRTLEALTPTDCQCGVVVDILRHHELFVYRDDRGMLNSVPIAYKPDNVHTVDSFDCNELLARMGQVFQGLLAESGDPKRSIVFETGDSVAWGYPFVYADGSNGTVLPLQYNQTAPGSFATSGLVQTTRTLSHTITGQVNSFIAHPMASLTRLFTLLGTTVSDVVHPTPLLILQGTPIPPVNTGPGMDLHKWERQLDRITGTTASQGKLAFHVDGKDFFPRLAELIKQAQQSVFLRLYIFDNDDYAIWFADFLKQRSETIDIRVIIDGLGTIGASAATPDHLPEDHATPMSIQRYLQANSRVQVHMLDNPWFTGDHTKTIIIDERTAFIGGMNIGREYRYNWHDLMTEVEGPVVNEILYEFNRAWTAGSLMGGLRTLFWQQQPRQPVDDDDEYDPVRVLYTKPGKSQILHTQVEAIRQARHRILLENAYLTSDKIIYELARARRRGVDVRVIIPYEIDYGIINRSNIIAANNMLKNGIRVYIYPGMSHVKAAIYDGWACLGSANFDNLSLRVNKELNLATSAATAVDKLKQQVFLPDMERSVELVEPLPDNWLDHLAELLADSL